MNIHTISTEETGNRLDKVMMSHISDTSRQTIQKWIKAGYITIDNQQKKPNHICVQGEIVSWELPVEEKQAILPENIPLDIVYEDEDLIVINKPKGMLVHPTTQVLNGTLVNAIMYHSPHLSDISGDDRPGIVHRLDKDTSGLLLVAKNNQVHDNLKTQFKNREIKRVYEAVVYGSLQHEQGVIKAPIGRNPKNRLQMTVVDDGKFAETHFRVIKHYQEYTHVECELKTGRTHQIRVHMKYINHPVVGDSLYVRKKSKLINGQALFAKKLGFIHPITQKPMTFEINKPAYFNALLQKLN